MFPQPQIENFIVDDLTSGDLSLEKQRDSLLLQHDIINFAKTPYRLEKVHLNWRLTNHRYLIIHSVVAIFRLLGLLRHFFVRVHDVSSSRSARSMAPGDAAIL